MIDITHKIKTLRIAIAQAVVKVSRPETIEAIRQKKVPKGDVIEASRVAALFAVKRTSEMIPDCHPVPVEFTSVTHEIAGQEISIFCEVHAIYRTGVEMEALHGASVAALTIYDMLKPIDKDIEIHSIRLIQKKGGKSGFPKGPAEDLKAAVIVCSDTVSQGKGEDASGKIIKERLEASEVDIKEYLIIPDEMTTIRETVFNLCEKGFDMILLTGGTGLSPRDVTPEAVRPLIEREIPGIMEAARSHGQERTPFSMLSRSMAGLRGNTLIITMPGSSNAVSETLDAIFPHVIHVFKVMKGERHP